VKVDDDPRCRLVRQRGQRPAQQTDRRGVDLSAHLGSSLASHANISRSLGANPGPLDLPVQDGKLVPQHGDLHIPGIRAPTQPDQAHKPP